MTKSLRAGPNLLRERLLNRSDHHGVQSLRSNAAVVLELGGGWAAGLPVFLKWIEARDDLGLARDAAEVEELEQLEHLAWQRASDPYVGRILIKANERASRAYAADAGRRQAELRQRCAVREQARRAGRQLNPQEREQVFQPIAAAPSPQKQRRKRSPNGLNPPREIAVALHNTVAEILHHIEDEMELFEEYPHEQLIDEGERLLAEIRLEPADPVVDPPAAPEPETEPEPAPAPAPDPEPAPEPVPVPVTVLSEAPSAWDALARELPEATTKAGLLCRLRNVLRQAPADGVIRLSAADGQALARMLMEHG